MMQFMSSLFEAGISNAVVACGFAMITAVLTWKSKWPAWTHALWVLVLLKLLTPPLFWIGTSIPSPAITSDSETSITVVESYEALGSSTGSVVVLSESSVNSAVPEVARPQAITWFGLFGIMWAVGTVCFAVRAGWHVLASLRWLRCASPASDRIHQLTAGLCNEIQLRHPPQVLVVPNVITPSVCWLGSRSVLVLPEKLIAELSSEELRTILMHELVHLRRGDGWVRLIEIVTSCVFWWHPVLPWARRRIHEAAEEACDAWETSVLPTSTEAYASAMLKTVDFLADESSVTRMPLATGMGDVHSLVKRMQKISRANTPATLSWRRWAAVITIAVCLLPLGLLTAEKLQAQEASRPAQPQAADQATPSVDPKLVDQNGVEAALRQKLSGKVSFQATDIPLEDVAKQLSTMCDVPIIVDRRALEEIGLTPDFPVSVSLSDVSLGSMLGIVLREVDLTYMIKDEVIQITTLEAAEGNLTNRVFSIPATMKDKPNEIIKALTATITPDFWEQLGGPGTVTPVGGKLAVSATEQVHELVGEFLAKLSGTQEMTVSIQDGTAILRATESTGFKYVQAVASAVRKAGANKLSLQLSEAGAPATGNANPTIRVSIENDHAEVGASKDASYEYVKQVLEHLQKAGIQKISLHN